MPSLHLVPTSLAVSCLPVCLPFARLLPWLGDGPMARLPVDIFRRPHRRQCWFCWHRELPLPVCQLKHAIRRFPRSKQRSNHPLWHHHVLLFGPGPWTFEMLNQNGRQKLPRLQARAAGCWGPVGPRPDWGLNGALETQQLKHVKHAFKTI